MAAAAVRGDVAIRGRPEGMIRWQRFRVGYIKVSGSDVAGFESVDECSLIRRSAATERVVAGARFKVREFGFIEKTDRLGVFRQEIHNMIRRRQGRFQFVQAKHGYSRSGMRPAPESEYRGTEWLQELGQALPNGAESDNENSLFREQAGRRSSLVCFPVVLQLIEVGGIKLPAVR